MTKPHLHRPRSQKITIKEKLRTAQTKSEFYRLPSMTVTLPKAPWDINNENVTTDNENVTTDNENVTNKYSD